MKTNAILGHSRWLVPAVLALVAGLSSEANALVLPVCNGVPSQPDSVRVRLTAYFGSYFPLDEKTCENITKKAVDACHDAVSDARNCVANLDHGTRKISKPVCGAQGSDKQSCDDDYKNLNEDQQAALKSETQDANDECDGDFADTFFDECINGLPHG